MGILGFLPEPASKEFLIHQYNQNYISLTRIFEGTTSHYCMSSYFIFEAILIINNTLPFLKKNLRGM
jgi:hypothetical protein